VVALTWAKVLGWRLRRQLLDPVGSGSVADVVGRLGAIPAWPDAAAELAVGARRTQGRSGDAARALAAAEVVKVYAFRGATHLMTPGDAGAYLALRASSKMWELPSWETFYGLTPSEWPRFREYVREALSGGPITHSELAAALGRSTRYRHLRTLLTEGHDNLLKPLTWQGDMGLGPIRDGEATFLRLDDVPGWAGIPDLDVAGPTVIEAYFRAHGPASPDRVFEWFGKGLGAKRRAIAGWLDDLGGRLVTLTVEGDRVLALREDLADIGMASPSTAVRLLPGRDPWVMAPGTSDTRVVPPARREPVSRSANLVVHRGIVAGTWTMHEERLSIAWFTESGRVPGTAVDEETAALGAFLHRQLDVVVELT
jgi:hypothetical protein